MFHRGIHQGIDVNPNNYLLNENCAKNTEESEGYTGRIFMIKPKNKNQLY